MHSPTRPVPIPPHLGPAGRALLALGLLVPLLATAACGGGAESSAKLVRSDGRLVDPKTREPYTGSYEVYFPNRRLSAKETYREGVLNGPFERYYESGQLFESGTYRSGVLEGPYEAYWEDGQLYELGTYRSGRYHGPRVWYLDGKLVERVTYVGGEMTGNYERYGADGTLETIGVLLRGAPCGLWFEQRRSIEYAPCGEAVATE